MRRSISIVGGERRISGDRISRLHNRAWRQLLVGCIPLAIAAGLLLPPAAFAGDVRPPAEAPLVAAWHREQLR